MELGVYLIYEGRTWICVQLELPREMSRGRDGTTYVCIQRNGPSHSQHTANAVRRALVQYKQSPFSNAGERGLRCNLWAPRLVRTLQQLPAFWPAWVLCKLRQIAHPPMHLDLQLETQRYGTNPAIGHLEDGQLCDFPATPAQHICATIVAVQSGPAVRRPWA